MLSSVIQGSTSWKAYLRPDLAKLVIGVMLFGLLSAFPASFCVEGGTVFGSPFPFYSQCNDPGPRFNFVPGEARFNAFALTVDLLLWYVVAASLVTLFRSRRERRGQGEKASSGTLTGTENQAGRVMERQAEDEWDG